MKHIAPLPVICVRGILSARMMETARTISLPLTGTPVRVRCISRATAVRSMIDPVNRIPVGTTVSFLFARIEDHSIDSSLGSCNGTSKSDASCSCSPEWQGERCQAKTDYCLNVTCENGGSCRRLVGNYSCECPTEDYFGPRCEDVSARIAIFRVVSKSFGYVGILSILAVAMFVIVMDVLKYCFDIDPARKELELLRKEKNRRPLIQRFIYVHGPIEDMTV